MLFFLSTNLNYLQIMENNKIKERANMVLSKNIEVKEIILKKDILFNSLKEYKFLSGKKVRFCSSEK